MSFRSLAAIVSLGLGPLLAALPADAQTRPLPQHVLSRGAVIITRPTPLPRTPHAVFGTIVILRPTTFALRTRTGRIVNVDASVAIRNETYSAPLFVGKTVVVEGSYKTRGTFDAVTVTRITRLEPATPQDH